MYTILSQQILNSKVLLVVIDEKKKGNFSGEF